eukprot:UN25748
MADPSRLCDGPGCQNPAKLQCPTCIKLGIVEGSHFCQQDCFKSNWKTHKSIHKAKKSEDKQPLQQNGFSVNDTLKGYNPYPNYHYSGVLRPHPLSDKRFVPEHIERPDYADHPSGYPASEMVVKRSTQIQVLNAEDIKSMREVCKRAREVLDIGAKAVKVGMNDR